MCGLCAGVISLVHFFHGYFIKNVLFWRTINLLTDVFGVDDGPVSVQLT